MSMLKLECASTRASVILLIDVEAFNLVGPGSRPTSTGLLWQVVALFTEGMLHIIVPGQQYSNKWVRWVSLCWRRPNVLVQYENFEDISRQVFLVFPRHSSLRRSSDVLQGPSNSRPGA